MVHSVLPYEGHCSLSAQMKDNLPIQSLTDLVQIVTGIASGMNFLHDKGVLHNHIVTDNVMVRNEMSPVLIGFSFACRAATVKSDCLEVIKKFTNQRHMAPELFRGAKVSYSSDVFAYGYILKNLLKMTSPASTTLLERMGSFSE